MDRVEKKKKRSLPPAGNTQRRSVSTPAMTSLPGSGVTQRPLDISLQTAEATGLLGRRRPGDAVKHHRGHGCQTSRMSPDTILLGENSKKTQKLTSVRITQVQWQKLKDKHRDLLCVWRQMMIMFYLKVERPQESRLIQRFLSQS